MEIIKFEFLKLLKKSRGWLGPILVFILIMVAYPLTVEVSDVELSQSFFFNTMDCFIISNNVGHRGYLFRRF